MRGSKSKISFNVFFLFADTFSLILSFIISYRIKFGDFGFISGDYWLPLLFIIILVNAVICLFSNPYKKLFSRPYYEEILRSLIITFYNLVAISVIFYVFKVGVLFSRQTILLMYILYFLISLIFKCVCKSIVKSGKARQMNAKKAGLLIVSDKPDYDEIIKSALAGDSDEFEIKAIYTPSCKSGSAQNIKILDNIGSIFDYAMRESISDIFIDAKPDILTEQDYKELVRNGITIHFSINNLIGFDAEHYSLDTVGIENSLSAGEYVFTQGQILYLKAKRLFDIIISLFGLLALIPVSAVIKLIYLFSGDKAKIIYRQNRIGKDGKPIRIFKFRTMIPDADSKLEELLKDDKLRAEWTANQKLTNDPRITKAGRILRRTSIDELPQVINVLLGEMSIVGPRPLVEGELEAHGGMKLYQQVKPGITGWWGCNGRSNINYTERLELEYYYIRNVSVYLDFLCILRTIVSVLIRRGAE